MEAKISVSEHDDKENVPPFLPPNKSGPDALKVQCTSVKKVNEVRRPLRDVTHLYKAAAQSGQPAFRSFRQPSSAMGRGVPSNRKRKFAEDRAEQKSFSKVLRRDFR